MAKVLVYEFWPSWDGGFTEMMEHLDRVKELGATHIWLSGFLQSPGFDHGYDVSDYCKINRRFGSMKHFRAFVKKAHKLGLKVLLDLVLNHTSIEHRWFSDHPEYYCWSEKPLEGWSSLFGGPAWEYSEKDEKYYCHLFHDTQVDLDWFPDGNISSDLVQEFRDIVKFWINEYDVDGFRLDVPQGINKNFASSELVLPDLLFGEKAISVINAVFSGLPKKPFLMMETLDPTMGKIVEKYVSQTPVDYCCNILLKETRDEDWISFMRAFYDSCRVDGFMLDLESHDSPRFTSRSNGMLGRQIAHMMFTSKAQAICLYQGQELGLKNPADLTIDEMRGLDVQSAIQLDQGASEVEVRPKSRANARIPIPVEEYEIQGKDRNSSLNWFKFYIQAWKKART